MDGNTILIGGSNAGAIAQGDHAQAYHKGDPGNPGPRGCMPLFPGDTVRLRSGGPLMTVLEARESVVRCAWFQGKENREGSFPAAALDREEPAWRCDKRGA